MATLKRKMSFGILGLLLAVSAQAQSGAQGAAGTAGDGAQNGAQNSAPRAAHRGHPPTEAERAQFAAKLKERMEKHLAMLHDKLKITSTQESSWKGFVDSITPVTLPTPPDRKAQEGLHAPDRLAQMLERLKTHEAKMQSHLDALKSLYAVLTPEQQTIMDEDVRHVMQRLHGLRERGFNRRGEAGFQHG